MKKIFYEKVGRRYRPVSEYDSDFLDAVPKGNHLVMSYPGGKSTRYNIDPNYAAMIAAGRVAEDAICTAMSQADEIQPPRRALTPQEHKAWMDLIEVWGEEARSLRRPAIRDIAEAGVLAMQKEATQLMQHDAVRLAFDHFLLVCEITKEKNHD